MIIVMMMMMMTTMMMMQIKMIYDCDDGNYNDADDGDDDYEFEYAN